MNTPIKLNFQLPNARDLSSDFTQRPDKLRPHKKTMHNEDGAMAYNTIEKQLAVTRKALLKPVAEVIRSKAQEDLEAISQGEKKDFTDFVAQNAIESENGTKYDLHCKWQIGINAKTPKYKVSQLKDALTVANTEQLLSFVDGFIRLQTDESRLKQDDPMQIQVYGSRGGATYPQSKIAGDDSGITIEGQEGQATSVTYSQNHGTNVVNSGASIIIDESDFNNKNSTLSNDPYVAVYGEQGGMIHMDSEGRVFDAGALDNQGVLREAGYEKTEHGWKRTADQFIANELGL